MNCNSEINQDEEIYQSIDLPEIPNFISTPSQSSNFTYNSLNEKHSTILLHPNNQYKLIKKFNLHLDIPQIEDWKLNIFDVNLAENYIVVACGSKLMLIPFNGIKSNVKNMVGKSKYIFECEDGINQIKIMKSDSENIYILAVDNKGLLHSKKIKFINNENILEDSEYKCFDCAIDTQDNSVWSLDCHYPYVIVGGNHKCVMIFNVEEKYESTPIKKNFIYVGNKHNVPFVSFSSCGEFISCACIDTEIKIWHTHSGKLLYKIVNKTNQWGWGSKFLPKQMFTITNGNSYQRESPNVLKSFINNLIKIDNIDYRDKINEVFINEDYINYTDKSNNKSRDMLNNEKESYFKNYIKNSLLNYYIVGTYKDSLFLNALVYAPKEDTLTQVNLGKINLTKNYFNQIINESNLSPILIHNMKYHLDYSRFEFIFSSKALNLLIVGNRQGDVHVYELVIKIYTDDKIGIKEEPLIIIDCNSRIAGLRVLDTESDKDPKKNFTEIYVMKVNRTFECYKISRADLN